MLFGGEARFHKDLKKTPSGIIYGNSFGDLTQTENHLGPGAYFSLQNENARNGWSPKSFSKREPMKPSPNTEKRRKDRNYDYVNGHIIQTGIALPGSFYETPGPGHYTGPIINSPNKPKKQSPEKSFSMGGTSERFVHTKEERMSYQNTVIKNGILVTGKDTSNQVGPGHYGTPGSQSLLKKSFNVKASSGNSSPRPSSASPAKYSHSNFGSPMSMAGRMEN